MPELVAVAAVVVAVVVVGMVGVVGVVVAVFAYPRLPLVEVVDGGEIVGVWCGDLPRERRRSLAGGAGSVSDLVVFGGLLLLAAPRDSKLQVHVYFGPPSLAAWRW
jgi:hypothetical protein